MTLSFTVKVPSVTLNLDLSSSVAKRDRAREHFETLNREIPASMQNGKPYTLIPDFDPETGWLSVKLHPEPPNFRFPVILGELVHDLRSSLDHIVSALVDVSEVTITKGHQFPIYSDETAFNKAVGSATTPIGCLKGIRYGFDVLRSFQPFHHQPDPADAPLSFLQRLSNSDKHRSILLLAGFPLSHDLHAVHDGIIIDTWIPGPLPWYPGGDTEIVRWRFAKPYPTKMGAEAKMRQNIVFIDRAFPRAYPDSTIFRLEDVAELGNQVDVIIGKIQAL